MTVLEVVLIAALVPIIGLLIWIVSKLRSRSTDNSIAPLETTLQTLKSEILEKQMEGMVTLRESLDRANELLTNRLSESSQALDGRLRVFGEIKDQLGHLTKQTQNIETIGNNIQSLSDLLKPPQLRGALGEIFLENLLAQILPQSLFDTQHTLRSGKRVDAIIKLADRLLPVDSKFPLETFRKLPDQPDENDIKALNKSIKKHIDDISAKYIVPDEGTTEFAVMYIPSEAVYYQLISQPESQGLQYALSKNVIPSSPGHLYAFLASVRAIYVEAGLVGKGRQLIAGLNHLQDSLDKLNKIQDKLEGSHRRTNSSLTQSRQELQTFATTLDGLCHSGSSDDAE